jgi:formylglycine-generating enzyme required for sulfatase activity
MKQIPASSDFVSGFADDLIAVGLADDATQAADTLWLAAQISLAAGLLPVEETVDKDRVVSTDRSIGSTNTENPQTSAPASTDQSSQPGFQSPTSDPTKKSKDPQGKGPRDAGLTIDAPDDNAGLALRISKGNVLPGQRAMASALRPLGRWLPSHAQRELDIDATIAVAANFMRVTRRWRLLGSLVLKPVRERAFAAAVIVDSSDSMAIWRATSQAFIDMIEGSGLFRTVRAYELSPPTSEPVGLTSTALIRRYHHVGSRANKEPFCPANMLEASTGPQLIFVLTDMIGPGWSNGSIFAALQDWSSCNAIALVHVLPRRLWAETALGDAEECRLIAPTGAPVVSMAVPLGRPIRHTSALTVMAPGLNAPSDDVFLMDGTLTNKDGEFDRDANILAVPVVVPSSGSLQALSDVLMGGSNASVTGYVVRQPEGFRSDRDIASDRMDNDSVSAEEIVNAFRAWASPGARWLAAYAAHLRDFNIVVMRLIQTVMEETVGGIASLAEVYLSGLLRRVRTVTVSHSTEAEQDAELVPLEYADREVARLLRRSIPAGASYRLLRHLSVEVARTLKQQNYFLAYLNGDASALQHLQDWDEWHGFASISAEALERLGGRYADLARVLKPGETAPVEHTPTRSNARMRYLNYMSEKTHEAPIRGLDLRARDAQPMSVIDLTDVYVEPSVLTHPKLSEERKGQRARQVSALTAFAAARRVVLLGDPGSGKSTFVNHLIHCLAQGQASSSGTPPPWPEDLPEDWRDLLPVRVVLREMAAWLRNREITGERVGLLHAYLQHWLAANGHSELFDEVCQNIAEGKAVLLLDGWDEVYEQGTALSELRGMLNELPATIPKCPLLVTCRLRSYAEASWRLGGHSWAGFTLVEFDNGKIDRFVNAWYRQLDQLGRVPDWEASASKLKTALRRADLRRMAGNPLLLTIMALDHADKGALPDARSVVYENMVELLLWKWRQAKPEEDTSLSLKDLLQQAGRREIHFMRMLWRIAFEAHSDAWADDDGERTADISVLTLRREFAHLSDPPSWDRADGFLRLLQFRTGLLIPTGPVTYTFPHRTLQEFLAACHLCNQEDVVSEALRLAQSGVYWREVVLLAVNRLAYQFGDTSRPRILIQHLCASSGGDGDGAGVWHSIALAGECVLEIGAERATSAPQIALVSQVRDRLTELVSGGHLRVPERVRAGSTLSRLGGPRDFSEMVEVPAGGFVMGSDRYSDELCHYVELDAFWIRKYPVTEREYEVFVSATGYSVPEHWRDGAPPVDRLNHPVVKVSWEDASAYCKWLSEESGRLYALPTEAQWEKAARGTEGREYPWGNKWAASRCANSVGGRKPRGTVAVGSYPTGASPYGCLDMSGNVWEWCWDWYGRDYYTTASRMNPMGPAEGRARILRGGAWYNNHPVDFRAAYRYRINPHNRYSDVGFRLVLQGF